MTIQTPNPGTGNGQTGDNEFVLWSKVKDNFTDQTNAASRLVGTAAGQVPLVENIPSLLGTAATKNTGTAAGQVPLAQDTFKAANGFLTSYITDATVNVNSFEMGTKYLVTGGAINTSPFDTQGQVQVIKTYAHHVNPSSILQEAQGYVTGQKSVRVNNGAWQPITTHTANYTRTTAAGANVAVDSTGALMRSTSSERYKDILAPLVLDDAKYAQAMALKPIVYRSTAEADNPNHHYYSFSAEELGAYDPAFTLWRTTEMVEDADGNITEQPLAEKQAEGININALLAMSHAIAIKQDKLIKALEARVAALEPKLEV